MCVALSSRIENFPAPPPKKTGFIGREKDSWCRLRPFQDKRVQGWVSVNNVDKTPPRTCTWSIGGNAPETGLRGRLLTASCRLDSRCWRASFAQLASNRRPSDGLGQPWSRHFCASQKVKWDAIFDMLNLYVVMIGLRGRKGGGRTRIWVEIAAGARFGLARRRFPRWNLARGGTLRTFEETARFSRGWKTLSGLSASSRRALMA